MLYIEEDLTLGSILMFQQKRKIIFYYERKKLFFYINRTLNKKLHTYNILHI